MFSPSVVSSSSAPSLPKTEKMSEPKKRKMLSPSVVSSSSAPSPPPPPLPFEWEIRKEKTKANLQHYHRTLRENLERTKIKLFASNFHEVHEIFLREWIRGACFIPVFMPKNRDEFFITELRSYLSCYNYCPILYGILEHGQPPGWHTIYHDDFLFCSETILIVPITQDAHFYDRVRLEYDIQPLPPFSIRSATPPPSLEISTNDTPV
jgi:hypothetical protein